MSGFKSKRQIIEDYLEGIGLSHEKQRISQNEESIKWIFRFKDSSVFLMLFYDEGQDYLWIEVAISQEKHFQYDLLLFLLKTHYSYLHPYRLAISDRGFLVVQYISPISKVCDEDFRLVLKDLLGFSEYVIQELKGKFILNSISFGKGASTSVERNK